jgi:hypothetical protein
VAGSIRITRHSEADGRVLIHEEFTMLPEQEATNTAEGMKYLEYTLLTVPGSPYPAGEISRALFQVLMLTGIKFMNTNMNTIHVIAFIPSESIWRRK